MFRKIDDNISVAGQIAPADIAEAARQGFAMIVNNRPDDEQPGQPSSAEMKQAAKASGLDYASIPIVPGGFSREQIAAMGRALDAAPGPVLAFCRSGTRSTFVWALARAAAGEDADVLAEKAAGAGYDISPIRVLL